MSSASNMLAAATRVFQKRHILLIEDNPGDARLVREALREAQTQSEIFELQWVERLQLGLKHVAESGTDLVLLDLSLPDAQGLVAIKHFHAAAPDLPVIVLTGVKHEATALEAMQLGAQDYIV